MSALARELTVRLIDLGRYILLQLLRFLMRAAVAAVLCVRRS